MTKELRFLLLLCIAFFIQINQLHAQTKKAELVFNKTFSGEIESGEKHQYAIKLEKDQFAFLKLMQNGIDVLITTFDPNGNKITEFDSPNGDRGFEFFSITSGNKGVYTLEVQPVNNDSAKGSYNLNIEKIEPKGKTNEKLVDQLFAAWDRKVSPGAAVAVVEDGKIVFKKGYGMANLEYDIPIRPDTIFHIASVSKQFTVFSILLLERDGKLSLDDDVRKYIPELPDFGKKITLRHLANHTSGLRDQWSLLAMAGWRLDDVITKEHILKMVSRQKELNFDPGDEYMYSNTGYTLLAEIVARVSGKSFPEFTDDRIFKPLGMKNSLFYDDHQKIVKNRAYSYAPANDGYIKLVLNYANVGATSLFTTVEDLSLWAMNFEDPKVGDREIFNKMKTQGVLNNGRKINYALGQEVGIYKGLNQISHSGGDAGFRSYLGRFPDEKFSVIVLSNDGSVNPQALALGVTDIYLNDKFKIEENKNTAQKTTANEEVKVPVETLRDYVGSYQLFPNFVITITQENGQLYGQATGQPRGGLIPLSKTKFKAQGVEAEFTFQRDEDGKVNVLKLFQNGQTIDANRIQPFDPKTVNLNDFKGNFYSEELGTEYIFTVEDGNLIAKHQRLSDIKITPVDKDIFTGNVWFFGQVKFERNAENKITGIRVSNGRVRNLWFERTN